MTSGRSILILAAVVAAAIVIGILLPQIQGPAVSAGAPVSGPLPVPAGANGKPDLTNQGSPQAAVFSNGRSVTPLGDPLPAIGLKKIAGGFSSPVMIVPGGDGSAMIVVDQIGVARVLEPDGTVDPVPFLDIRDRMVQLTPAYDERGLLSLAFHPAFSSNGRIFVYYSAPLRPGAPAGWSCTNRLSEFRVTGGRANPASEKILLEVDKPSSNHNGGPLLFGPDDGYLYLALGDGGGADDTGIGHAPGTGNAQDMTTLLGKIIRIDVDGPASDGAAYAIPPDNPFTSTAGVRPEIYASGLRNPAYLSFDTGPGHHLIAAVAGQKLFEPIYVVTRGGNYGWNIREGTHCFNPAADPAPLQGTCATTGSRGEPLIGPVIELGHDLGSVVVGGYVYRGTALPALSGSYVFGDWSSSFLPPGNGVLLAAFPPGNSTLALYPAFSENVTPAENRMWITRKLPVATTSSGTAGGFVRGFGTDRTGELYVLTSGTAGPDPSGTSGTVWKLVPA